MNGDFTGAETGCLRSANWGIFAGRYRAKHEKRAHAFKGSCGSNVHEMVRPFPLLFAYVLLMIEQLPLECPTSANTLFYAACLAAETISVFTHDERVAQDFCCWSPLSLVPTRLFILLKLIDPVA
jgi:hypothetical protein